MTANGRGFFCNPTTEQSMFPMVSMKGNGGRCIFGICWFFFSSAAIGGSFRFLRMGFLGVHGLTTHSVWWFFFFFLVGGSVLFLLIWIMMDMRGRFGDFGFTSIFAFSFSLNGLEKSMGTEHLDEPTILISKRMDVRVIGCDTGKCYPAVPRDADADAEVRHGPVRGRDRPAPWDWPASWAAAPRM